MRPSPMLSSRLVYIRLPESVMNGPVIECQVVSARRFPSPIDS